MAVPVISNLPPAPSRSDGPADFTPKADAMIGALQPMVVQINIATQWMAGQLTETQAQAAAAAASALAAANSATAANASKNAAAQSAIDATNNGAAQVTLAADQVVLANAARNSAEVLAAAAQAAAGAPSLLGNAYKVLRVNAAGTAVAWTSEQQIGDLLSTARNPGTLYLPANGGIYSRAAYPLLAAILPNIGNPAGKVWTNTTDTTGVAASGISTDGKGVWVKGARRSTDNGLTFPATVTGVSNNFALLSDGNQTWIGVNSIATTIYRSTDNGLTFSSVGTIPSGGSSNPQIATDGAGTWVVIAYSNAFRVSKDNGATWSTPATAPTGAQGVCFIGANTWLTSNGYRSTDGGLTWATYGTPAGQPTTGASMLYLGGNVILSLSSTAIRRSTDGGFSWTSAVPVSNSTASYGLCTDGNGGVLAVASSNVLYSSDYGLSWQAVTMPAGYTAINFPAFGMGKFILTVGATGYVSSVETFDYDTATQFKLPTPQPTPGMKHYIKAKEA